MNIKKYVITMSILSSGIFAQQITVNTLIENSEIKMITKAPAENLNTTELINSTEKENSFTAANYYSKILNFHDEKLLLRKKNKDEKNWQVSLSFGARNLSNFKVKKNTFGDAKSLQFLDGTFSEINPDYYDVTVNDKLTQNWQAAADTYRFSTFSAKTDKMDFSDNFSYGLLLNRNISENENYKFGIDFELGITQAQDNFFANGDAEYYAISFPYDGFLNVTIEGIEKIDINPNSVQTRYENHLFMASFLVGPSWQLKLDDNWSLNIGFGLGINWAKMESSVSLKGFDKNSGKLALSYYQEDVERKILASAYGKIGLTYTINSKWALGFNYRYEYIGNIENEIIDGNLKNHNFQISLTYSF